MDLLGEYSSDTPSDDETPSITLSQKMRPIDRRALNAAPTPSQLVALRSIIARRSDSTALSTELTSGPMQGPAALDPYGPTGQSRGELGPREKNYQIGELDFRKQRHSFQRTGRALAPTSIKQDQTEEFVESSQLGVQSWNNNGTAPKKRRRVDIEAQVEKESLVHDSDDEERYGIWAPPSKSEQALLQDQTTQIDTVGGPEFLSPEQQEERKHIAERNRQRGLKEDASTQENQNFDRMVERKMKHLLPPRMAEEDPEPMEAKSIFHGTEEFDYKGQSWMEPPAGTRKGVENDVSDHTCYVPKKCVHRFTGHNKGVQRIRMFPLTGHLLLSAGLDNKCKIWSIPLKQVMRTYIGHTAAVRDVAFNNTGKQFVSASYDRFLRLWDTETGKVINSFTNRRVPYVVKFYPNDNDFIVVGCSDNKVVAYNIHTAEVTQEYNHHLAPVNTITFLNDGAQMLTSSDDKKVLLWEWDIGVPIKYIMDPTLHSMPAITLHPSQKYWIGQSLDNEIKVYEATGKMSVQKRKKFSGHQVAGYACDVAISPDGRFVMSGDGGGRLFFWDWRMNK